MPADHTSSYSAAAEQAEPGAAEGLAQRALALVVALLQPFLLIASGIDEGLEGGGQVLGGKAEAKRLERLECGHEISGLVWQLRFVRISSSTAADLSKQHDPRAGQSGGGPEGLTMLNYNAVHMRYQPYPLAVLRPALDEALYSELCASFPDTAMFGQVLAVLVRRHS